MQISQNQANQQILQLGFLLLLNVPSEMQFGIDNQFWKIGPKFMGLKMIPYGAHFVYFALKDEEYQSRQGFWIIIDKKQKILVKEFSKSLQRFVDMESEQDTISYQEGVKNMDFDQNLGAYPQSQDLWKWQQISNKIDQNLLEKLRQNNKIKDDKKEEKSENKKDEKDDLNLEETVEQIQKQLDEIIISGENQETQIYFTDVPKNKIYSGLQNENLTKVNFDKSSIFNDIQKQQENLLGEFQIAFIQFLILESLPSFEQWKKLIILFCNCETEIHKNQQFFMDLIPIIYAQFSELPEEFFHSLPGNDDFQKNSNFLGHSINQLIEISHGNSKIMKRLQVLLKMLKEKFNFEPKQTINTILNKNKKIEIKQVISQLNEIDDSDDELPQIVDLNEQFISF